MKNIENEILIKVKKAGRGSLFFNSDFTRFGSAVAVNKALERLVGKNELIRVARGIYTRPKVSDISGITMPSIQEVAKALARRDRAKIIPTGAMAMYQLGLTTQVPLKIVYLTDGSARAVKVGKFKILFKKTSPKNLAVQGEASKLAIQALKEIGEDNLKKEQEQKIIEVLKKENRHKLQHDIRLAPEWIRTIMKKAL